MNFIYQITRDLFNFWLNKIFYFLAKMYFPKKFQKYPCRIKTQRKFLSCSNARRHFISFDDAIVKV